MLIADITIQKFGGMKGRVNIEKAAQKMTGCSTGEL